jgi:hypothetical protein
MGDPGIAAYAKQSSGASMSARIASRIASPKTSPAYKFIVSAHYVADFGYLLTQLLFDVSAPFLLVSAP